MSVDDDANPDLESGPHALLAAPLSDLVTARRPHRPSTRRIPSRAGSTLLLSALLTLAVTAGGRTQEWSLVTAELHDKASQQGAVRVLVQLASPFVAEPQPLTPAHVAARRRDIAAAQSLVRGSLSGVGH